MEITAKEIERQAGRVDEEVVNFDRSANVVIKMLMEMSNIVKSDDSNLSKTIDTYTNHFIRLQTNVKNNFGNLANIMHQYASRTLKNEELTSEEVSKASSNMEEINSNISSNSIAGNSNSEVTRINNLTSSNYDRTNGYEAGDLSAFQ